MGDEMDLMHKIAERVAEKVGASFEWIAKQNSDEFDDLFGIAFRGAKELGWKGEFAGFCAVTVKDAAMAWTIVGELEPLIIRLATEVMGYAPGSTEHLENQYSRAIAEFDELTSQIANAEKRRSSVFRFITATSLKLRSAWLDELAQS